MKTRLDTLSDLYTQWCRDHELPDDMSADELLADTDNTQQAAWLTAFIDLWHAEQALEGTKFDNMLSAFRDTHEVMSLAEFEKDRYEGPIKGPRDNIAQVHVYDEILHIQEMDTGEYSASVGDTHWTAPDLHWLERVYLGALVDAGLSGIG